MDLRREIAAVIDDPVRLSRAQGAFNIVAGAWPLVSLKSFEAIFGPKYDRWLEYTVACLLLTSGVAQWQAGPEVASARRIGIGTAASLLAIDLVFVPNGRIRWTYLVDGAMEAGWIAAWWRSGRR